MRIIFTPQRSDNKCEYEEIDEKLKVIYNDEIEEVFDFSTLKEGETLKIEPDFLPIHPIINVIKENGEIVVTVIKLYGEKEKERYEN